jgi:hypothetical protein
MKKNMGLTDRVFRMMIAIVIVVLYFTGVIEGAVGLVLLALAAIFVLTSLISVCPLYLPFGLSSIRRKMSSKNE